MDIKKTLKGSVAVGALMAFATPFAFTSSADAAGIKQWGNLDLKVGGKVGKALVYIDNGEDEQLFHTDSRTNGTRLYFQANGAMTESVSIRGHLEFDVAQFGDSYSFGSTGGSNEAVSNSSTFAARDQYIKFTHKSAGSLTIGQESGASDGAVNNRYGLSGDIIVAPGVAAGGVRFRTGAGADSLTAADQFSNQDGGRDQVIRYDSPSFGGFAVAGSFHQAGVTEVAAKYSGSFAGISVKGAIAYDHGVAGGGDKRIAGSFAAKHSSGLHIGFGRGQSTTENSGRKPKYTRYSGGYEAKLNSFGNTDFYVVFHDNEDVAAAGNEAEDLTLGVVQKFDNVGLIVGATYSKISLEDTAGTDYQDIDAFIVSLDLSF